VTLTAEVSEAGRSFNPTIELGPGLGDVSETTASSSYIQKAQGIYFSEGKIRRMSAKELASQRSHEVSTGTSVSTTTTSCRSRCQPGLRARTTSRS